MEELAGNHVTKLGKRRCAEWGATVAAVQRGGDTRMAGTKANTPEETEAAVEELGPDCIRIYTDGGGRRHGGLGRARGASARGRPVEGAGGPLEPRRDRQDVGLVNRLYVRHQQ